MQMMEGFVRNKYRGNILETLSKGKWNDFKWYRRKFYLMKRDEAGNEVACDDQPFAHTFFLAGAEHKKSTSYPQIYTILFDEFLTNNRYLINEFKSFLSIVSTIVRLEDYVRIFMCGNTVSQYCPYFADMGINRVKSMKRGTIDIYKYGESGLEVAVEYADFPDAKKNSPVRKKSDVYFAFNNSPTLKMITEGEWETEMYPHLPANYHPWDIFYKFYILFDNEIFECELIDNYYESGILPFMYIHRKTTPIKDDENRKMGYYCYKQDYDNRPYYSRNIIRPRNYMEETIARYFKEDRVFYQDNLLGESIRRYVEWCGTN